MKGLEFGKSGAEGIRGEGIDETSGWASLKNTPFIGEEMEEQADEIRRRLELIDIDDNEIEQDIQTKTSENTQEGDILKQNDTESAELHDILNSIDLGSIFGR
jgi:hypothetical protein